MSTKYVLVDGRALYVMFQNSRHTDCDPRSALTPSERLRLMFVTDEEDHFGPELKFVSQGRNSIHFENITKISIAACLKSYNIKNQEICVVYTHLHF